MAIQKFNLNKIQNPFLHEDTNKDKKKKTKNNFPVNPKRNNDYQSTRSYCKHPNVQIITKETGYGYCPDCNQFVFMRNLATRK